MKMISGYESSIQFSDGQVMEELEFPASATLQQVFTQTMQFAAEAAESLDEEDRDGLEIVSVDIRVLMVTGESS